MKKYLGFFFVVCFLMQINNLLYGQDDRWVYIKESELSIFYKDKLTIKCDNYGNIVVWVKSICLSNCEIKSLGKTISYSLSKIKFFSHEEKYKELASVNYFTDGFSTSEGEWSENYDIVPDSMIEFIYNYVFSNFSCK